MIQSKISQLREDKPCVSESTPRRSLESLDSPELGAPGAGEVAGERAFPGDRAPGWAGEKALEQDGGEGCTALELHLTS